MNIKTQLLCGLVLTMTTAIKIPAQDLILKVWPEFIPGSIDAPDYAMESIMGDDSKLRISRVTDPVLEVFHAPGDNFSGAAVIICPGGGYHRLSVTHEGYKTAAWLNEHGITGIILKYRLPHDAIMEDKSIGPLQDAQEAIRIVRRNADEWGLDPQQIGILGYSAGGHLAASASTRFDEVVYPPADNTSARPDFSILVYPVISFDPSIYHGGSSRNLLGDDPEAEQVLKFSNETRVNETTPPAFLVHSLDDRAVPPENSIRYMQALRKHGIPVELHLFEGGGHGYGPGERPGHTELSWPDLCIKWLKMNKFVQ
jgi:acetyl esterase/lipase